ncbi:uncharacterized protein LOC116106725 [Pistacia vera]|uniref:Uncharacterized protein n=1 Tax=Pistacia atlantica TaxID=434234 RepID=A0ACC1BV73_9ROSI|nr:uncharacterized protein LOC116106725 [Pistacia vera]KAJ0102964.1 hypothetical protein Patl1_05105 [Pistacia atlantica]
MAKIKDDIKYGTAQAKLSEDDTLRVSYKHGTPLEGGKIADSEPIDLFSSAHNINKNPNPSNNNTNVNDSSHHHPSSGTYQSQLHPRPDRREAGGGGKFQSSNTNTSG